MTDFAMRNFDDFPLEKSSYDLKLELLEELHPKEALELMKVNNGFRSIYLKDPWRIIGRRVHSIVCQKDTIEICKLRGSESLSCDLSVHLPLLMKIKNCVLFYMTRHGRTQQVNHTARKVLSNLDSIGEWDWLSLDLWSFNGQITDSIHIYLNFWWMKGNDPDLSFVSKVFESQLRNCESVGINFCIDQFSVVSKLFSKTRIQRISLRVVDFITRGDHDTLEMMIHWIVCNGIPSQHREAEISLSHSERYRDTAHHCTENFLSTFPGMQQMPDEQKIRIYRRKFDDKRDCVYQFERNERFQTYTFSAKYLPSQAQ